MYLFCFKVATDLSGGVQIWYTGINLDLLHYIPQPDLHIGMKLQKQE